MLSVEDWLENFSWNVLLLGEVHGTNEMPDFFYSLVSLLRNRGRNCFVHLELPIEFNEVIRTQTSSGGDLYDLFYRSSLWSKCPDGRATVAMARLLALLVADSDESLIINCFDPRSSISGSAEANEAALTNSLCLGIDAHGRDSTQLVLCGNLHAMSKDGAPRALPYKTMGQRMVELNYAVRSLLLAHEGGTFTGIIDGFDEMRTHDSKGWPNANSYRNMIAPCDSCESYDWKYGIGKISASSTL